jgi:branched-chain amino acid transport system substrate-binding protein
MGIALMGATTHVLRRGALAAVAAAALVTAAACGGSGSTNTANDSSDNSGGGGSSSGTPVKVGMVYSQTGLLASYGKEYRAGFKAGLKYVTHGTGKVAGHPIKVSWADAAGDPSKATSAFKNFVGQGYKIIAGPTDSGVAVQLAPLAKQNKVLFISGPAATDAVTGANNYTFRSGRETYQDVKTAAATIGDPSGKKVVVFAQDYEFGKANATAVKAVLGGEGATVSNILAPLSAKDFTPYTAKIKQAKPDLLFVAWAGDTTQTMWQTLDQQSVFKQTTVVTGLGDTASYGAYGSAADKVDFLSYYFPGAPDNKVNTAMVKDIKAAGGTPDLFSPDGFVAAQMIARAVSKGSSDDVQSMIKALNGWTFTAPKGQETVRAADHAMIQDMYVAHLQKKGDHYEPKLVKTVAAKKVAPPAGSGS